ncbi:MAG: hypothetical protein LBB84_11140 [Tannerellaceae bacterium]|nr:hypothetical protein [Tannerellaceae bacterium]
MKLSDTLMKHSAFITLAILISFISCKQQPKEIEETDTEIFLQTDTAGNETTGTDVSPAKSPSRHFFYPDSLLWKTATIDSARHDFYREMHYRITSLFFSGADKTKEHLQTIKHLEQVEGLIEDNVVDSLLVKEYEAVMLNLAYCYAKAGNWEKATRKNIKLSIYEKYPSEGYQVVSLLNALRQYKQTGNNVSFRNSMEDIKRHYEAMRMRNTEEYDNCIHIMNHINRQK